MTCQYVRERIHDYLDGELPANQASTLEVHLEHCEICSNELEDLRWTRHLLSGRERLPQPACEYILRQVNLRAGTSWKSWFLEQWSDMISYWRDLDRPILWSKLSAVPVTVGFFVMILMQFPLVSVQEWTYPAFTIRQLPSSVFSESLLTQVQARHTSAEIGDLMSAAWKIPYEDSLSLLAEITPEGNAEIGHVLEYPKSQTLLQAVDDTFRSARFQTAQSRHQRKHVNRAVVIYSLQKIDVYGDLPEL
jgi:hypothetical protein